jgi:purine nucleosidase
MTLLPLVLLGLLADPVPVLVSSDCGCEMDDQWAIAVLATSPAIDLRAVITAHAPGLTSEAAAGHARAVFERLPGVRKVPVVAGSSRPIQDPTTPNRGPGVDRLLAESKGFTPDHRLTVVMIGPATDVASALLIDPSFADRVKVVSMAFDEWPKGNDPFNVRNDVAAWQVVMHSSVPLTVADGDVTRRRLTLTRDEARARLGGIGPAGEYLVSLHTRWLDRSGRLAKEITGSADAWPVWDCGAVAVLLGHAKVEQHPRPRLRDDRTLDHSTPAGTIGWVTEIDGERFWADFAARLKPAP